MMKKYFMMGFKENQFVISEPYFYSYYSTYNKYNVYIYTERPVYRPGQIVYFKGIIRLKDLQGNWQNYPDKYVKINILVKKTCYSS